MSISYSWKKPWPPSCRARPSFELRLRVVKGDGQHKVRTRRGADEQHARIDGRVRWKVEAVEALRET